MKKLLSLLSLCLALLALCFTLTACSDGENEGDDASTIVLNVYNWGEYISDGSLGSYDTNAEFEKYCKEKLGKNVKVIYTTYATNEDMYAKITSGAGTYDIIIPSDYMIQKLREEKMLYAFDPAKNIPNYQYIQDTYKNLFYDEENLYSVPYTYGKVGIIYNKTMLTEEDLAKIEVGEGSWSLLFDEKYKGKILQFNNPRDAFGTAMYWKGININSAEKSDWDEALRLLTEQKPLVQGYVSDEIFNKMTGGSAAIATYYAGDYLSMVERNENLGFFYPKEGTNEFVDAMCIPKNAKQKELAMEYINFMLSEEAAVANATYICYGCPNTLVLDSDEYREEMGDEAYEVLYSQTENPYPYDPMYYGLTSGEMGEAGIQALVNNYWETLKTENAIELWVHITSALIVVGVLSYAIYDLYIKKKRSRFYRKSQSGK
ncbi:MAG: spermidine/putrescine ABC transporter substrate-binding protein [Clostridia bacterium]|nr:spermidine/putrescine ABC transporter substrate-binding protein [Clostridia bacterium]